MILFPYIVIFLFGLLFGSFLNVCIYRIPRKESIVFPGSHCPNCQRPIKPWENIPLISFLVLRGKCRGCQEPISWRYPLVELLTALILVAIVYQFSFTLSALFYSIFACALIVISFIDLDYRIIPDKISLPGIVVGILGSLWLVTPWYATFLGTVVGGGVILITGYIGSLAFKKEAMGGGDVKLMAMVGAFLGWKLALLTIFFASLVGAIIGIGMKLSTGDEYIPFGPFLSLGALLAMFFGRALLAWYWNVVLAPPV
ncbi:prepilin peptidase [candidate division KSB3 bacterium]|uniref:Prepilin leader peptidase/N-methyltransferase n=1 Tax=candidate division KSB3 bacterium TaxID=2044937 RepID=A0A9D5Q5J0_9BACT|nr:prepilin peptidase [candidate division KSB3 bacterium]MBD3323941.1 prepilin peptidase [candidate division KSB3 bacterium]